MTNENLALTGTLTKSAQKRSSTPTRSDSPCRSGAVADAVFPDTATTAISNSADLRLAQGYQKRHYIRLRQMALKALEIEGCVSCAI
ncbi:hypothetical protein MJ581_15500 [Escherichia coli]|nr:hypothetical protein MJ581_15500 [Escherichia coli]